MKKTARWLLSFSVIATATCFLYEPEICSAQCDKPALLIILDKSSSMVTGTVPSGETKWEAAAVAITTVTINFEDLIDFGLMVFPYPDRCNPGHVVVEIGPSTSTEINSYLADPPPEGGNWTPMSQTLEAAASYPPLNDTSLRRIVVLVTDGWQWCSPYDPATRFDPVDSAEILRATGSTLYTVGFGDGVDSLTLNRIAYQSGTYIPGCNPEETDPYADDNCYYKAMDIDSLIDALESITREATEEVCDGIDNDCDDLIDEDLMRACSTICGSGTEICDSGIWINCDAPQPSEEICDGLNDEDCDTIVDEGCECTTGEARACGLDVGECHSGIQTCIEGLWGDCEGATGPEPERCDGLDNDCDGTVDEGCLCVDGDVRSCGIETGACSTGTQTCIGGSWGGCEGAVEPEPESCNGLDDDCDGVTDEGCLCSEGETRPCGTDTGECVAGTQTCRDGRWSGCEGAVWPDIEYCDGLDNDCNSVIDNNAICPPGKVCIDGECVNQFPDPEPEPAPEVSEIADEPDSSDAYEFIDDVYYWDGYWEDGYYSGGTKEAAGCGCSIVK